MSQQPNQNVPTQSQPQQTGSETDAKPFSIREYVFACRQKNIHNNWPFGEKHLQLCLKHGIKEVLPPFDRKIPHVDILDNITHLQNDADDKEDDSRLAEVPNLIDDQSQSTKNNCDNKVTNQSSSNEEGNQHNSITSANFSQTEDTCTLASSNQVYEVVKKNKRRRRKGRCKKRSMVDILAVARRCTLEEIQSMNQYIYADLPVEEETASELDDEASCGSCK